MNIMLACCAGMSTSLLVERMRDAAAAKNLDHTIFACPLESIENHLHEVDVILLGPQIRTEVQAVKEIARSVPVEVIKPADYGRLNGAAVLAMAEKIKKG